jgi:acetylornithine/N-succinyldiaminopimelate aminotransferase
MTMMTFEEVKTKLDDSTMPTYARFPAAIASGKNATAFDVQGKEYVDFTSGIGVNCLGYADPEWSAAVAKQAAAVQHISNLFYSPVQAELAEKLCTVSGMGKVFFCNSGAEANECSIKLARKYGEEKLGIEKPEIITLNNSFHGRTITTLAATGQKVFHEHFLPLTEGFRTADATTESVKACVTENTCAVLAEMIQGEGGVIPLEPAFVKELREFCTEHKLLFIVDEVQTGIGRTGEFFAYRSYGIMPDVISIAKALAGGLPMGACLCREELGNVLGCGMHGSTFGGNPVACAGALVVLNRVSQPEFLENVRKMGNYFTERLKKMPGVTEVRGMGLILGAKPKAGTPGEIAQKCVENGLLILTAKEMLRFLPPLTITKEEADRGLAILEAVLNSMN